MTTKIWITFASIAIIGMGAFFIYPKFKNFHERDHHRAGIETFVKNGIQAYELRGVSVFKEFSDQSNPQWVQDDGETYMFVINGMSARLVAHGGGLVEPQGSTQALIKYLVSLAKEQPDGRWVVYQFINPKTGKEQIKRTYLQMHDDYVFGSGKYVGKHRRKRHD